MLLPHSHSLYRFFSKSKSEFIKPKQRENSRNKTHLINPQNLDMILKTFITKSSYFSYLDSYRWRNIFNLHIITHHFKRLVSLIDVLISIDLHRNEMPRKKRVRRNITRRRNSFQQTREFCDAPIYRKTNPCSFLLGESTEKA